MKEAKQLISQFQRLIPGKSMPLREVADCLNQHLETLGIQTEYHYTEQVLKQVTTGSLSKERSITVTNHLKTLMSQFMALSSNRAQQIQPISKGKSKRNRKRKCMATIEIEEVENSKNSKKRKILTL